MENGRIPKYILYWERIDGKRNLGRPTIERCVQTEHEATEYWPEKMEELATDRFKWRSYLQATLKVGKESIITVLENKLRKEKLNTANLVVASTVTNSLYP